MVKIIAEGQNGRFTMEQLLQVMKVLRSPEGCPWDREQDHKSIRNDGIEEIYEVADAIDSDDKDALCEELGDVLLQVVFHAQIALENGEFSFDDVVDGICKKLILRHPHVFGEGQAETSDQVLDLWDKIKKKEKHQSTATDTLKSVPKAFPALIRAAKVQKRAIKAGADIPDPLKNGSLMETVTELEKAVASGDTERTEKLYGKLLFLSAGLQNKIKINAEQTLSAATDRYISVFEEKEKENSL